MLKLSQKQHTEAGVVIGLLLMLAGFYTGLFFYFKLSFASLLISLVVPSLFFPFSFIWFNLSEKLGGVMSLLIMSIIYSLIVFPMGLIRRMAGKDSLSLGKFKKARTSVFTDRNITFAAEHLDKTY